MDGTLFGRYRLVELLGRGGMGEVWRAHDTATNRTVAIKLLPPHLAGDETFVRRFRREAEAAARLNNPHIIPIHTYGEIDGRLYVDMRLIEGRDLQTVLTDGPLSPERAVAIIDQVAKALHAAHKVGLVHRDVKPSNILIDEDDFAYLIDFGIARGADETRMTGTGNVIGSWAYMSPERLQSGRVDARADIYALACVLYECLTGNTPYPGDTLEQQITAHLTAPPPCPSNTDPNIPVAFDTVIATGMAKTPDERYPTTVQLADAARNAITSSIAAAGPTMPAQRSTEQAPGWLPESTALAGHWPTPVGLSPSAATQLGPQPQGPQQQSGLETQPPDQAPPARGPRSRRVLWGAIAGGALAIVAVVTVVLVTTNRDGGGSASAPSGGPFTGTFNVDFGAVTDLEGAPVGGQPPTKETWNLRSKCGANGCVATASRTSGNTLLSSTLVFDDVGGRWLAVAVAPDKCQGVDAESWEVFSLQPQPGGILAGEFTSTTASGCASERTVTFTRSGDAQDDSLVDPASLPARVVSPAYGLRGAYHATFVYTNGESKSEFDYSIRTECLRSGDRCLSFFDSANGVDALEFADGRFTRTIEINTRCPGGGPAHLKQTAEYPLPQPPEDPIAMLTGHGQQEVTGDCDGADFDEQFVRTGD